jgi:aryl-alcohol dehydrogenase-like predicted oxidoreductase
MARELGMGVTPWSPLRGGALTGKYTRENAHQTEQIANRGWMQLYFNEQMYRVVDELKRIASELDTTPARVALAWVQGRPGVSSTIIGARTVAQLEDNLKALEVELTPAQVAKLDQLTTPTLNFPARFLSSAGSIQAGGTTINGEPSQVSQWGVQKLGDHY